MTRETDMTATPLPDWGFVLLHHDGQAWRLTHQDERVLYRNADIAPDEMTVARRWAAALMTDLAATPDGMGHHADMYGLDRCDGQLTAMPVGGLGRDDLGWILVDGLGHVTHRAGDIDHDDQKAANRRVERIYRARRPPRWRLNVGVFPDGSYGDYHGVLGRQRARRAWNQVLDVLRIG
jgi:hypothetical protein